MKSGDLTTRAKTIWETSLRKAPTEVKISEEEMGDYLVIYHGNSDDRLLESFWLFVNVEFRPTIRPRAIQHPHIVPAVTAALHRRPGPLLTRLLYTLPSNCTSRQTLRFRNA